LWPFPELLYILGRNETFGIRIQVNVYVPVSVSPRLEVRYGTARLLTGVDHTKARRVIHPGQRVFGRSRACRIGSLRLGARHQQPKRERHQ
jgi:hypothetical protein